MPEISACYVNSVCRSCMDESSDSEDNTTDDDDGDDPDFQGSCDDINDEFCQAYGSSATCTRNDEFEAYVGEHLDPIVA